MLKGVEKRAENNLDVVEKAFVSIYEDKFCSSERNRLERTIYVRKLHDLSEVKLKYISENRFWSISFNLKYSSTICSFGKSKSCIEEEISKNEMIKDRMKSLDIKRLEIEELNDEIYEISFQSLIGSSTWLFIPPVMQLIKPKEKEIAEITEIFMLASSIIK